MLSSKCNHHLSITVFLLFSSMYTIDLCQVDSEVWPVVQSFAGEKTKNYAILDQLQWIRQMCLKKKMFTETYGHSSISHESQAIFLLQKLINWTNFDQYSGRIILLLPNYITQFKRTGKLCGSIPLCQLRRIIIYQKVISSHYKYKI